LISFALLGNITMLPLLAGLHHQYIRV